MKKELFDSPIIEIISLDHCDIITDSLPPVGGDEWD